jgi:hypothetical protein
LVRELLVDWWPKPGMVRRLVIGFLALLLVFVGVMFSISQWYAHTQASKPETLGVSFIPDYASSLGVDPQTTMDNLLDIGVKHFRLVSYWSEGEPTQGQYDFSQLDWQFQKAEAAHAHIILTLGLRQPRWPECHVPNWVDTTKPLSQWQPELENYIQAVVNRYKSSPALDRYQLENEYFLKGFGTCTDSSRSRLVSEYNLVQKLDPSHQIVVGRSNNALGFPLGKPTPDEWSISVYKRVWDAGVTHRYLEYPQPAWFYGFIAGVQKLVWHHNMLIAELQAEPWPPNGKTIPEVSLREQDKSFDAQRFNDRFGYAKQTGMKEVYFWGAEYWYYRKAVLHDNSVWNVARQHFSSLSQS